MRDIVSPLLGFGSPFGRRRRDTLASVIAALFGNDEPGFLIDPSDPATVFSDTDGTTQAEIGDPVARINSKSGNGNHATQPTLASRPILREAGGLRYLEFDGVDDFMVTTAITPGTNKVQVFAGARKLSDAVTAFLTEHTDSSGFNRFALVAPSSNGANSYAMASIGGSGSTQTAGTGVFAPAPISSVVSGLSDVAAPFVRLRHNGQLIATNTASQGSASNFRADVIYIGARGVPSGFFTGNIYSLIVRFGPNLDAATIERTERYVASKTGVTL